MADPGELVGLAPEGVEGLLGAPREDLLRVIARLSGVLELIAMNGDPWVEADTLKGWALQGLSGRSRDEIS